MKSIVNKLVKNLKKHGIKVKLIKSKFVQYGDGTICNGYFDETNKTMKVAVGKPIIKWFPTFIHEYCHFEQWLNNAPQWYNSAEDEQYTLNLAMDHFNGYLKLTKKQLNDYLHRAAEVELDCEKRVIKKIKENNLPIDVKKYTQRANAYIAFYYAMEKLKSWYDFPPYESEEILNIMPSTIRGVNHKKLGKKLVKLFEKHCIKQ